ncbi:MAG: ATP-binding protein [Nitrospirota bacterium]
MELKRFAFSLTGKLIFTIGTMMFIGSTLFWYTLIRHEEQDYLEDAVRQGISFGELVKRSTDYGMLTFHQPMIQHTVGDIAQTEGVIYVRIFDSIGRVAYSSNKNDIGTILDKSATACKSCHLGPEAPQIKEIWSFKKSPEGYRILNTVLPIYNKPACYTSACHAHSKEQKVLGLVDSALSLEYVDKRIKQHKIALTTYVLSILFISAVVLWIILWNIISKPLRILRRGMRRVTAGELDYTIRIDAEDEMGELAKVFNTMTSELSKAKKELLDWGQTLEKKVEEKTKEIRKAQAQLIHSAKLASLGRMAAGVAHEINSPLTGIVTFGHLLRNRFPEGSQEREDIEVIIEQANRCSSIINGLLGFARATTGEKGTVNINDVLKSSLNMIRHKADFFNINIIIDLDESLPPVKADPSQLQQVFLNMIINAADAMDGKGTLTVCTRKVNKDENAFAEAEFTDTGHGITEENMAKLFEPFFTTKPTGKGTGLGLAVSHGIIQEHGGKILVKSKVGEGTSFFVRLPFYEDYEVRHE